MIIFLYKYIYSDKIYLKYIKMLIGIKSSIVLKKIMSYLKDEKKLKLLKYNKKVQNILNITIIDFLKLSGKYIIDQKDGIKYIYNSYNDELIYEGE